MKFCKALIQCLSLAIIGLSTAQAQSPFQANDFVLIPALGVEVQRHEVTYLQWNALDAQMPPDRQSPWLKPNFCYDAENIKNTSDNFPVGCISKFDAQAFIHILNKQDPRYNYRLPEDSEQVALIEMTLKEINNKFPNPTDKYRVLDYTWLNENSADQTHEVCTRAPVLGLCDILGNVTEWNQTTYNAGSGDAICRGGYWGTKLMYISNLSVGIPEMVPNDARSSASGFRLIRTAK